MYQAIYPTNRSAFCHAQGVAYFFGFQGLGTGFQKV
jgi:hypothetical protein